MTPMPETRLEEIPVIRCNAKNRGGTRRADQIKYLVYHYTGNDGDTARANARYYRDTVVQASAHYFVDDDTVIESVEPLGIAWAVGGKKWSDCPRTGGGKLYGAVTNANSISIEMCDTRRDGTLMATEATMERALALGRALMERYHIPIERVVRHFDVTGKHCPAYLMDAAAWAGFKERLLKQEDEMDQNRFDAMMDDYLARRGAMPPGEWSREAREWAQKTGIIVGGESGFQYPALCSREQVVTMLYRMAREKE